MPHARAGGAMTDHLLGLDFGTGGAKACVIDTKGRVLGYSFVEFPLIHERPGWSEHDALRYWTSACELIRRSVTEAKVDSATIRGIAVSSALPCIARDILQGHVDQLCRRICGWKCLTIPGDLADAVVQRLDRIGRIHGLSDLGGVCQERGDRPTAPEAPSCPPDSPPEPSCR